MFRANLNLESKISIIILVFSLNKDYFRLDCTEAQFSFIGIYMISTLSPGFWSKSVNNLSEIKYHPLLFFFKIPYLQIEYRILVAILTIGSTIWSSSNNIRAVSQGGCGRNFSSVAVRRKFI